MVLVSGPTSGSPAHYLDPEDKIVPVKSGAPPTAMFVLCVNMPGQAPLEILDSIRQNVSFKTILLHFCMIASSFPASYSSLRMALPSRAAPEGIWCGGRGVRPSGVGVCWTAVPCCVTGRRR